MHMLAGAKSALRLGPVFNRLVAVKAEIAREHFRNMVTLRGKGDGRGEGRRERRRERRKKFEYLAVPA